LSSAWVLERGSNDVDGDLRSIQWTACLMRVCTISEEDKVYYKTCPLLAHEVLLAVVGHRVLGKMDSLMLLKSKGSAKSLPDGSQNGI
jgi:hypothetical protein